MKPPAAYIALNRASFGATNEELARLAKLGWPAWVEEQLKPTQEDPEADNRIANHRMRIEYEFEGEMAPAMMVPGGKMSMMGGEKSAMMAEAPAGGESEKKSKERPKEKFQVDEKRRLTLLDKPLDQLFLAQHRDEYPYEEMERAVDEVVVATIIRACYSKWQVREMLVDFWHNHFNINIDSDSTIMAVWPAFDRDVIRKHALGNFREMLEAVAQSLPAVPHQACQAHCLRAAGQLTFDADRAMKKQLKASFRQALPRLRHRIQALPAADPFRAVLLDYTAALHSVLPEGGVAPFELGGIRVFDALADLESSVLRCQKKGITSCCAGCWL